MLRCFISIAVRARSADDGGRLIDRDCLSLKYPYLKAWVFILKLSFVLSFCVLYAFPLSFNFSLYADSPKELLNTLIIY